MQQKFKCDYCDLPPRWAFYTTEHGKKLNWVEGNFVCDQHRKTVEDSYEHLSTR